MIGLVRVIDVADVGEPMNVPIAILWQDQLCYEVLVRCSMLLNQCEPTLYYKLGNFDDQFLFASADHNFSVN